jgi:hypothetical protein
MGFDVCVPRLALRPLAPSVHGSREEQGLGAGELRMADSKFKSRTSPESEVRKAGNGTRDTGTGHGDGRLMIAVFRVGQSARRPWRRAIER